jgi:hypothetical protein
MLEEENNKQIIINGTNNRYLIKRANRVKNVPKTRAIINKYNLTMKDLDYNKQLDLLKEIYLYQLNGEKEVNENSKEYSKEKEIILKEIENKISSYKHQDLLKKHFDPEHFITSEILIPKMVESNMKCYYCSCEMFILYENVREMSQWSVDRIDNSMGHNKDNFVLSCLNCNIKRRNRSSDKFLFSKQMNIIKQDS